MATKKRLLGLALIAGFDCVSASADTVVDYDGYTYTLGVKYSYPNPITDTDGEFSRVISKQPWFTGTSDDSLAKGLATTVGDKLGKFYTGLGPFNEYVGPDFIYNGSAPSSVNPSYASASTCQYTHEDSILGGRTRCIVGGGYNIFNLSNTDYYAYEVSPRVKIGPAAGILAQGDVIGGSAVNVTSNLGSKLLPSFEGGVLTVDQANAVISTAFTVDGSATNAVDANDNSTVFSGVFSDSNSSPGHLGFINNASGSGSVVLTGVNTYTGHTTVGDRVILGLRDGGSIGASSSIEIQQGARLSVDYSASPSFQNQEALLRNVSGDGTLQLASPVQVVINQDTTFGGFLNGSATLRKTGPATWSLTGNQNRLTGPSNPEFKIEEGRLHLTGSLQAKSVTVAQNAILSGTGTIQGDVVNSGVVSPGASIGILTVDGSYLSSTTPGQASLEIEVDGSSSDLLRISGDNRLVLLSGDLNISSYNQAPVSPGKIYTAIDVTGANAFGGELALTTNLNVVGSSGLKFVREIDPEFAQISDAAKAYYETCTSSDPTIQQNCTKLQFAWLKLNPQTAKPIPVTATKKPGKSTIQSVRKTGGAITTASSGNVAANVKTCTGNSATDAYCQQINQPGTGSSGHNANTVSTAKSLDAGWASVSSAVTTGVSGGTAIGTTGYTTNQTAAALVSPDFVNVIGALFAVPTRQQLNQALHQITAEPYASMQSVALEALEQFRSNTLALTQSRRLPFVVEEEACESTPGSEQATEERVASEDQQSCKPVTRKRLTPWSLLIDGSNTQATLEGTNDLASLDYNIFSSSYGLQYDFNRNWSAGAAFGYGRANLYNYEYSNTRIESDTYSGAIWGLYRPSDFWKFTALAGYMNLQYDSKRQISFGGLDRTATASWSGNGFTTALAAEYDWILSSDKKSRSAVRIKPSTFFSYALHNQSSFSEAGAESLNLAVDSHTADSLIYGIGLTVETPIITGRHSRLIPRLYVGYEYDFNGDSNEEHQLSTSFAEVPALGSMDVLGQNRGADAVDVALSLEYEGSESLSVYGNVGGSFWSNGNEINYGAGLRLRW